MKILARVDRYLPDVRAGSEITLHQELRWLAARGHEVVVMREGATPSTIEGVSITSPETACLATHLAWCDVVVTQQGMVTQAIREAAGGPPVVFFAHSYGQGFTSKVRPGELALVVYCSHALARANAHFVAPSLVVHPPVYVKDYRVVGGARDRVLQVGLSLKKGGGMFPQIANYFKRCNSIDSFVSKVSIKFLGVKNGYGEQVDQQYFAPDNALIIDTQEDMRSVYGSASALIFPSEKETYGRVALEAACSGIPLILSDTPGLVEAVGGMNALWAKPNDIGMWIAHIEEVNRNEKLRNALSAAALARALEAEAAIEPEMLALENALLQVANPLRARVWAVGSEVHYVDHAAAYLHAIDPRDRGPMVISPGIGLDPLPAYERSMGLGLVTMLMPTIRGRSHRDDVVNAMGRPDTGGSVVVVVSQRDRNWAEQVFPGRVVRGEHGAGQTYVDVNHHSFPGGPGHKGCLAATAPNEQVAEKIRQVNPNLPVAPVGCPKLHLFHKYRKGITTRAPDRKPRIVFSFRYPGGETFCPELGSAWAHFRDRILALKGKRLEGEWDVAIHCHPRAQKTFEIAAFASSNVVRLIPDFEEVLQWADVYAVDNSSTALEWLHVRNGGLLLLNAPEYRQWVNHGLRFWLLSRWPGVTLCPADGDLGENAKAALGSVSEFPWYFESSPLRLAHWLRRMLRSSDLYCIHVLQSCDGQAGRLLKGSTVWVGCDYADQLCAKGLAVMVRLRDMPQSIPYTSIDAPDLPTKIAIERAIMWTNP